MSYCRWSTNDYQCALYCYESADGYMTHVAANRPVLGELPPAVPLKDSTIHDYIVRHEKLMAMLETCERLPIGLPHDGESFCDTTLKDFRDRLLMLRDCGHQFPASVIEAVESEIADTKQQGEGDA